MKKRKIIKKAFIVAIVIIIIIYAVIWSLFGNLIRSLKTIERIGDTQLFIMDFKGDYGLDEFLETGAASDGELVNFVIKQLLHGIPIEFELPQFGCSTFAAETPEGNNIFGRNFDMYYSPALFVRTTPDNGYKSVSMVNLGFIGYSRDRLPTNFLSSVMSLAAPYAPVDGMNEKGLAVGVLLIYTEPTNQNTDKIDITTTSAVRMILDKCASVDEAVEMLKNYDMHASAGSNYHFHIADVSGRSVVIEYIGNEMNVVEAPAATNFLLTPGEYSFGSGQDRYAIVMSMLENYSFSVTNAQAMAILEAAKKEATPESANTTQWSCVYDLDNLTVDIAVGEDYDNIYSFSLENW